MPRGYPRLGSISLDHGNVGVIPNHCRDAVIRGDVGRTPTAARRVPNAATGRRTSIRLIFTSFSIGRGIHRIGANWLD